MGTEDLNEHHQESVGKGLLLGILYSICFFFSGFMFLFSDFLNLTISDDDPSPLGIIAIWIALFVGWEAVGVVLILFGILIIYAHLPTEQDSIDEIHNVREISSINSRPVTDAFELRLNYPKGVEEDRKFLFSWGMFSYGMIWFLALAVLADDVEINSVWDYLTVPLIFLSFTFLSTSIFYYYGLGYCDVVYLRFNFLFWMVSSFHAVWFTSSILVMQLTGVSSTFFTDDFTYLQGLENQIGFDLDIAYFGIFWIVCLLCFYILAIPMNKFWERHYEATWRENIRK